MPGSHRGKLCQELMCLYCGCIVALMLLGTSTQALQHGPRRALSDMKSSEKGWEAQRYKRHLLQYSDNDYDYASSDDYTSEGEGDDRSLVNDTTAFPYQAIGWLVVTKEDGSAGLCTGALIAPNFVLTAAHCLWSSRRGYSDQAIFVPAYDPHRSEGPQDSAPYGSAGFQNAWVSQDYRECGRGYGYCNVVSSGSGIVDQ